MLKLEKLNVPRAGKGVPRVWPSCVSIAVMLALTVSGCGTPSDARLVDNFGRHRHDFEILRAMAMREEGINTIAPSYVNASTREGNKDAERRLGDRLLEYRRLFTKLGLRGGVTLSDASPCSIYFRSYGSGMATGGVSKGYAYCEQEPAVLVPSLDPGCNVDTEVWTYRRIDGDWYLYCYSAD